MRRRGPAARDLLARGVKPDAIVVDPPRSGMDAAAINAILALSPEKLLMISCDSATAARDARALCQGGYTPRILEMWICSREPGISNQYS